MHFRKFCQKYSDQLFEIKRADVSLVFKALPLKGLEISMKRANSKSAEGPLTLTATGKELNRLKLMETEQVLIAGARCRLEIFPSGMFMKVLAIREKDVVALEISSAECAICVALIEANWSLMTGEIMREDLPQDLSPGRIFIAPN